MSDPRQRGPKPSRYVESVQRLGFNELAPILTNAEADAVLSVLEQAINAGITPERGLQQDGAESGGFRIVSERFRDNDPYSRGARTVAVTLRSPCTRCNNTGVVIEVADGGGATDGEFEYERPCDCRPTSDEGGTDG